MNMLVIEHGPEISMPGVARSFGTGGTFQSVVVIALAGKGSGNRPCLSARASRSSRLARSACAREANSSHRRTR